MNINRRVISLSILSIMTVSVAAQKAKVVSAYNYNKSYERDKDCSELVKGIESIEPATDDPKTNTWAKTWYYGGNLYFNAALTQDEECAKKFDNALENCYRYYLTSMKYNIEDEGSNDLDLTSEQDLFKLFGYFANKNTEYDDQTYFRDIIGNKFPYLANAFINKGVEAFQDKNFEKALNYSEKSIEVNMFLSKVDSLGMYNAALAAERLEQYDKALEYYTGLTKIKYGGPSIYLYIVNLHERMEDSTARIETIRKGLEAYPENPDLNRLELSHLLEIGKTEEALSSFDKTIESDPENPSLYYNRGVIFDQLGRAEEAAADYNKALEVDSTFFDAAYNLGAMYYNMGVEENNKASSYGIKENDKYEEASKKASEFFAKAQPALEKAHELNPEDQSTMASLVKIYAIVGEDDKYTKMKAKLDGK